MGIKKRRNGLSFTPSYIGTPEGTRTPNPRNRNPMLYPLSHRRIHQYRDIIAPMFGGLSFTPSYIGTPEGTRTPNPRNRNPMLYPLSHRRIHQYRDIIAPMFGFVKSKNKIISRSPRGAKELYFIGRCATINEILGQKIPQNVFGGRIMAAPQNFRSAFNGSPRGAKELYFIGRCATINEILGQKIPQNVFGGRIMAAPQNFRSAFNGFHREDVVNYIAYMTNQNETKVNQLNTQIAQLQQEVETLRQQSDDQQDTQQQMQELRQELEQTKQQLAQRDEQIRRMEEEQKAQKQTAPEPPKPDMTRVTEELNAYRRAESMERRAREQVNQMFDQASGVLADTPESRSTRCSIKPAVCWRTPR